MISITANIDKKIDKFIWNYEQSAFKISFETLGKGKAILLLPSFSTVSSRSEMNAIAEFLASQYQVTVFDWLGFGESDRPKIDYQPNIYQQLLTDFVNHYFSEPIIIVTAGHSAGYALTLAKNNPDLVAKIILIAPTAQGPLKVMGVNDNVRKFVKNLINTPILGQFLYYLNTTPAFLRFMYRRHVFVNESQLTPEFINRKRQITQQKGARFGSVAFVTGEIDPLDSREEFLNLISEIKQPIFNIIGENSPPYSLKTMEAISKLNNVQTIRLSGTLGMAEEYGDLIAALIQ
ncbi:alpha/beta hydrolase [Geminocystis sp. CENA526]|uniref:alpha/beta hydrolase n=1 Tax=Geminocystis sp. CENA526 TaxID=1355871 RepID=UPI003D6FC410